MVRSLCVLVIKCALVVNGTVGLVLTIVVMGELWAVLMLVVLTSVVGHVSFMFVVNGSLMSLSLELNMGFLLVMVLSVRVSDVRDLVVDGGVVDNARLIVMLMMMVALRLDVAVRVLMEISNLSVSVLALVVHGLGVVRVAVLTRVVVPVLCVLLLVGVMGSHWGLVVSSHWGLVVHGGLVESGSLVMHGVVLVVGQSGVMDGNGGMVRGSVVTVVVVEGRGVVVASGLVDGVSVVAGAVGEAVLGSAITVSGQVVTRDVVLHLTTKEDLGESKTDGVTELIEVLVLPLGLSIHDFVVHILSIDNKIVLNMEDEVPRVSESLGHLAELVEISADSSLALFELISDIVKDMSEILNTVKNGVKGSVLELVNNTTEALPDVLGIAEALNTVGNLSLNGASEHTLKDLAHSEEGEVHIGGLHGLEVVHLLILLVINLIQKLLPMVIEIEEEFLVVDHLGLSVKKHGGGLTEVLSGINPFAHAVVMETLTGVLEDVDTVDDKRLVGLEQDLLGVEESLCHSLDLLVIVMINLSAVIEHVADVGDSETELVDGLGGLLVGSIPESAHGVLEVLLNGVGIGNAVGNIGHTVEVEGTNEETLDETANFGVIMGVVG